MSLFVASAPHRPGSSSCTATASRFLGTSRIRSVRFPSSNESKFVHLTCGHLTNSLDLTFSQHSATRRIVQTVVLEPTTKSWSNQLKFPTAFATKLDPEDLTSTPKEPHYSIHSTTALPVPLLGKTAAFTRTPTRSVASSNIALASIDHSPDKRYYHTGNLPRTRPPSVNPPGARSYPRIPS